jgi:sugar lactone lactonase YvrE
VTINNPQPTRLASPRAALGEGPVWHQSALWWVDIDAGALYRHASDKDCRLVSRFTDTLGCIIPRTVGGWIAGLGSRLDWLGADGCVLNSVNLPRESALTRCNDGKADAAGRVWIGTMARDATGALGSLYRVDLDGSIHVMLTGLGIANGLGWSPDGKSFYFVDSLRQEVSVFKFDPRGGELGERHTFAVIPTALGVPDGLTVDSSGDLWLALWGGASVIRLDGKTGRIRDRYFLPAPHVTSCGWGGHDLSTLFITTASCPLDDAGRAAYPDAGALFSLQIPETTGLPVALANL